MNESILFADKCQVSEPNTVPLICIGVPKNISGSENKISFWPKTFLEKVQLIIKSTFKWIADDMARGAAIHNRMHERSQLNKYYADHYFYIR